MRAYVRALLTIVVLAGCGSQQTLPEQPNIAVSPGAITFRQETGSKYFVGVMPYGMDGLVITDEGQNPLTITKLTLSGDTAFFSFVNPAPEGMYCDAGVGGGAVCTINRPPDSAVVTLQFAPTSAGVNARDGGLFNAVLTIESNGVNDGGTVVVPVSAVGIIPDAG
jgi:hypothetical protein